MAATRYNTAQSSCSGGFSGGQRAEAAFVAKVAVPTQRDRLGFLDSFFFFGVSAIGATRESKSGMYLCGVSCNTSGIHDAHPNNKKMVRWIMKRNLRKKSGRPLYCLSSGIGDKTYGWCRSHGCGMTMMKKKENRLPAV